MWLRWIAVTLLVILCINSVGTIALSAESQKEGNISETEFREEKSIPEGKKSFKKQRSREASPKVQETAEGFDIDFFVIIDGKRIKLRHNDITGIATWKDGRTTYYGVSIEDLLLIYEEFGFVKNGENQNPDANNKFVFAYRGKSKIGRASCRERV